MAFEMSPAEVLVAAQAVNVSVANAANLGDAVEFMGARDNTLRRAVDTINDALRSDLRRAGCPTGEVSAWMVRIHDEARRLRAA